MPTPSFIRQVSIILSMRPWMAGSRTFSTSAALCCRICSPSLAILSAVDIRLYEVRFFGANYSNTTFWSKKCNTLVVIGEG